MFDVLMYLFENYAHPASCPEPEQLVRKLSALGFDEDDIVEALEWLAGLISEDNESVPQLLPHPGALRVYLPSEEAQLDLACRGYLNMMEQAGVIDPDCRERVINRAMALDRAPLSLPKLKIIVLMVLWQRDQQVDALLLDDLLSSAGLIAPLPLQ